MDDLMAELLQSLLGTADEGGLLSNNLTKVDLDELDGKVVCLYFAANSTVDSLNDRCRNFTAILTRVYYEMKSRSDDFEVVLVSLDKELESFQAHCKALPWLALPFADSVTRNKLVNKFQVERLPRLVVFDKQGKMINRDAHQLVMQQGSQAFDMKRMSRALDSDLQSLLGSDNKALLKHDLQEMDISDVKQRFVGLLFSAQWSRRARSFTRKLITVYQELKAQREDFEVIFISTDHDADSFRSYYSTMPWLALPFSDQSTKLELVNRFQVREIPRLIILDSSRGVVTTQGCALVMEFGSRAFPFTKAHVSTLTSEFSDIDQRSSDRVGENYGGTHVWIVNNTQPSCEKCGICKQSFCGSRYICKDCSYGLAGQGWPMQEETEVSEIETGIAPAEARGIAPGKRNYEIPPVISKKSASSLLDWIDPETKRTIIGSVMAGLFTVVVGVASFCCSKLM